MQFNMSTGKQIFIGNIKTSDIELRDLLKAWVVIAFAFAMVLKGFSGLSFYQVFIMSAITVGTGFLLHELAHKFVAQRYGCFAEFRSFDQMLILAVIMSFFGFVFAAPGAVMIHGPVGKKRNGIISAAGPVTNLILAMFFVMLYFIFPGGFVQILAKFGFYVNAWLALFNMIPFMNFDGAKILKWNKMVYGSLVGVSIIFMFIQSYL